MDPTPKKGVKAWLAGLPGAGAPHVALVRAGLFLAGVIAGLLGAPELQDELHRLAAGLSGW